ncbi:integrase catalytic domain-containing protein [Trichonephila clavipes]|nr:integrase catalytic domain-containing protein [Trichonephila clavipes]
MSVIAHQTEKEWILANERKADKECHKHRLRAQQSNMQPDLRMHICKHIIRVLQHQKDVNQKQHICVKHDFVIVLSQGSSISSSHINSTSLTFSEIKTTEEIIIRWVQDEHGLVRVGGRLQNSQLRFNSKHPIILPCQHSISELLIKEQHIAHLHAGPTLKCLKCNKFKTSTTTPQLMGNLPKHRVTLERPYFSCGIDYAGSVLIKYNKGRGTKFTKGYIALFICLAIKAVHIEAVGDLTTDSFIAALRRFSARRGALHHIYSDNETNFVGACRKPDEIRNSRVASFNLQPQRSLRVATEYQTWLLEEVGISDFLSSLQPRKKWQDAKPNLKEDDIVLIKKESPPGTWPMARVLQVHPGNDGLVRVATVKTKDSVSKRPVHKLLIYPNLFGYRVGVCFLHSSHLNVTERAILSRLPTPTETFEPRTGTIL